jgi:hypothetical protein
MAASLIKSGVSKSGSPAARAITSLPSDFNFSALAVMARVGDSFIRLTQFDSVILDKIYSIDH